MTAAMRALLVVVAACSGDKPEAKPAPTAPPPSAPAKPTLAIIGDPCPLDFTLEQEDEWPGCPENGPFLDDEAMLGVSSLPCAESEMDRSGDLLFTTTYARDASGRLLGSQTADEHGITDKITYRYDATGHHASSEIEGMSSVRWTYQRDAQGRLVTTTMVDDRSGFGTQVTTYQRDAAGRLTAIDERGEHGAVQHQTLTWRDGAVVETSRDATENGKRSVHTTKVKRDAHGRRAEIIRSNGSEVKTVGFVYDDLGRLVELRRLTTIDGKPEPSKTTTVRYDDNSRVFEIEDANRVRRYRYVCTSHE